MLHVALTSILARKRRLFTTAAAIVLSVAFVSGTLVITALIDSTLNGLIGSSYRAFDAVVRSANATESRFGQPIRPPIDATTVDLVRAARGVAAAEGFVQGLPTLLDKDGERIQDTFGPPTLALNWVADAGLRGGTLAPGGRAPRTESEAVIDVRTAKDFGFKVGDSIVAQLPAGLKTFTIVGIGGAKTDDQALAAGPRLLILEEATAQKLLNKVGQFDFVAATATDGTDEAALTATLRTIVPSTDQVITGDSFIEETESSISTVISLFTQPILAFGYISVFVGVFVIYNTFSIVVAQRTRELALLRAVGASRGQILGSVLLEASIVGLVASVLGIASGWILAVALKGLLSKAFTLPAGVPAPNLTSILTSLAVGLGATLLSAIIPAIRATTVPPVAALGEVALDRSATSTARKVAGPALIAGGVALIALALTEAWDIGLVGIGIGAAMLFVAVAVAGPLIAAPTAKVLGAPLPRLRGMAGRLARENAGRNPKRTATTAAALSIGVGLVTVVAVFAASIRGATESQLSNQLAAIDLVIDTGTGFGGLSPEAAEFLRNRPEVERLTPLRFNLVTLLTSKGAREEQAQRGTTENGSAVGEPEFMIGMDLDAAFKMVRFDGLTPRIATLATGEIMVLESTADENGWKVGDRIPVSFAQTGRQTLRIAATFAARVGQGASIISNLDTLTANATPEFRTDSTIWVQLRDGVSAATALSAIKPELKKIAPTAGVNTTGDYLGDRLKIVDSVVNLIYVLLGLSIVIALVGVANTISLSIYERTKELGLLRAVGMDRRQVRISVRWESAIIALAGTVIGLVVGVSLAIAFVNALDERSITPIVNIGTVVTIGVLGAIAGILTGIRPAGRAARVDVLGAISSV